MIEWAKKKVRQAFNWVKERYKYLLYIGITIVAILAIWLFGLTTWIENNIQISKCIKITDIVSTAVAFVVFFLGYQISKAQKNIAKEKLKLDLFDRRYKIYSVFKKACRNLLDKNTTNDPFNDPKKTIFSQEDPFRKIGILLDESQFLLDKDTYNKLDEIFFYITVLYKNINEKNHSDPTANLIASVTSLDREKRGKFLASNIHTNEIYKKIIEYNSDLPKIFAKYMSFDDLKIK